MGKLNNILQKALRLFVIPEEEYQATEKAKMESRRESAKRTIEFIEGYSAGGVKSHNVNTSNDPIEATKITDEVKKPAQPHPFQWEQINFQKSVQQSVNAGGEGDAFFEFRLVRDFIKLKLKESFSSNKKSSAKSGVKPSYEEIAQINESKNRALDLQLAEHNKQVYTKDITDEKLLEYFKPLRDHVIGEMFDARENKQLTGSIAKTIESQRANIIAGFDKGFLDLIKSYAFALEKSQIDLARVIPNETFQAQLFIKMQELINSNEVFDGASIRPKLSYSRTHQVFKIESCLSSDGVKEVSKYTDLAFFQYVSFVPSNGKWDDLPNVTHEKSIFLFSSGEGVELRFKSHGMKVPRNSEIYCPNDLNIIDNRNLVEIEHAKLHLNGNLTCDAKLINSELFLYSKDVLLHFGDNVVGAEITASSNSVVKLINFDTTKLTGKFEHLVVEKNPEKKFYEAANPSGAVSLTSSKIECTSFESSLQKLENTEIISRNGAIFKDVNSLAGLKIKTPEIMIVPATFSSLENAKYDDAYIVLAENERAVSNARVNIRNGVGNLPKSEITHSALVNTTDKNAEVHIGK